MSDNERSTAGQHRVSQPTRGAARNAKTLTRSGEQQLLPTLARGLTLLDIEGERGVSLLQSLVLDHLLVHDGPAFWVDADGYATTTALAGIAPSQRLLDRIHVARGFTAYQHYGALRAVSTAVDRPTTPDTTHPSREDRPGAGTHSDRGTTRGTHPGGGPSQPPALVVAPAVDARYREADTLTGEQARTLLARSLARLASYVDEYDVSVLLTRTAADAFSAPIETAADHQLRCERTDLGPRFVGDEFETRVYPVDGGSYQTTLTYWRRLLATRAEQVGVQPTQTPPPADSAAGNSHGTAGTTGTPNPLFDAWTGPASAGGY